LNHRTNGWTSALKSSFVSTSTQKGRAQSLSVDLREAHSKGPGRVETYAHLAFLRDEFAGINQRYAADAGLGFPLIRTKQQAFKFDFGLGYTRELRFSGSVPAFPTAVVSSVYTWAISPTSSLSNETRGTSNLRHGSDWRLANSLSVSVGLSRLLALKLSDKLSYLNSPVTGYVRTDTVLSAALVLQFAK
jgi:putative salt-induced outer membrane protein YdiY